MDALPAQSAPVGEEASALELPLFAAALLFTNGQSTERTVEAAARITASLGIRARLLARWGELVIIAENGEVRTVLADPLGVDMGKVAAALEVIDRFCAGAIDAAAAHAALEAVRRRPPVALLRFAALAAAGAAALGVIFGATNLLGLALIALSAGAGACLRRWVAKLGSNPFAQPFCAALLAGAVGAVATDLELNTAELLVAVCPCMVLVPGPHLLNGALDLARGRIALGMPRIFYAGLTITMICIGLLGGLALGGVTLPASGASTSVPLPYDVLAAGVAVAAFGTFFSMPWRTLPIPIAIGMAAHAARWAALSLAGTSVETGAFIACLLVGIVTTPVADRMRLPFAAFGFAAVVSLIPGIFLFRMGSGLVALADLGAKAPSDLLPAVVANGATAFLILLAMAFGLIVPKLFIEGFLPGLAFGRRPEAH